MVKKQAKSKHIKINKKKFIRTLLIIVFIVILIVVIKNTKKVPVSDKTIVILQNQDITANLKKEVMKQDDIVYMSFDDIKTFIDKNIYQESDQIVTSSKKKLAILDIESNKIKINGSNININGKILKNEDGTIYLPISEMENVYDIDFTYNEATNIITMDYYSKKMVKAYAKKNITIKSEKKRFSSNIEKIKKGSWVIYISEEDGWAKVRTQDGKIGYVKPKKLTNFVTEREDMQENKTNVKYLDIDISKKNISTLKKREKVISQILLNVVNKDYKGVKIIYKDKKEQEITRFKIEIEPIFEECGIDVEYEGK